MSYDQFQCNAFLISIQCILFFALKAWQQQHQNASSPRSRQQSPSFNNSSKVISPSGLLTDGPLGRRPNVKSSRSPHKDSRERSSSPVFNNGLNKKQQLVNGTSGSNSSLHTIQESAKLMSVKQAQNIRKSFLPQPVQHQQQQQQIQPGRKPSVSPIRQHQHVSPSWKDGCY